MTFNERLPRKLKKQLKKNPEEWVEYLEEKRIAKEKHESLNLIFTRDYKRSGQLVRRLIRTGKW